MPIRRGALLLILLAGCVSSEPLRPGGVWQSLKIESDPGPDRVLFDIALVQRPLGDHFLSEELWASADEMIVPADQREMLELNGYRVGLLVGSPPDKLLHLLQSERSRLDRRGRSTPSGTIVEQKLRECDEVIESFLQVGRSQEKLALDRPRFGLDLLPTLKPNGIVRLKIAPRYEAGDRAVNYKPLPQESKWTLEVKRPTRVIADLAFEFDLAPNQILIVGPCLEREGSLGFHSLTSDADGAPNQRLMILRHMRSRSTASADDAIPNSSNTPLARQATEF